MKKKYKYFDVSRELKKTVEHEGEVYANYNCSSQYNHQRINKKIGGLGNKGRVGTIKTTALLRSARILRRVLKTCCHWNSSERPSANTDVKNSQGVTIIIKKKSLPTINYQQIIKEVITSWKKVDNIWLDNKKSLWYFPKNVDNRMSEND